MATPKTKTQSVKDAERVIAPERSEEDELESSLLSNGFRQISCFGAYDPAVKAGSTDRIVALADRKLRTR